MDYSILKEKRIPNDFFLLAEIVWIGHLRYTPVGLSIREVSLLHESDILEAGYPRHVILRIRSVIIGPLALQLEGMKVGDSLKAWGFLAPVNHEKNELLFHIQRAHLC